jgi:hypothetical protein
MNKTLVGAERWIVIFMLAIILGVLLLGSLESKVGSTFLVCALVLSAAVNLQFLVYFHKRRGFDKAPWCAMLFLLYFMIGFPIASVAEPAAAWLAKSAWVRTFI